MDLEWEPLATPKRGYEHEFQDLLARLAHTTGPKRMQLLDWLANVSIPTFTTIGAPRVGFDAEADEWLRARVEKSNRLGELEQMAVFPAGSTERNGHVLFAAAKWCTYWSLRGVVLRSHHSAEEAGQA